MTSAILVSAQFWYANQGGVYVLWYLPLLVLMIFRPNLSNERPPPLPEDDWLQRVGRRIRQYLARFVRKPDTFVKNV